MPLHLAEAQRKTSTFPVTEAYNLKLSLPEQGGGMGACSSFHGGLYLIRSTWPRREWVKPWISV